MINIEDKIFIFNNVFPEYVIDSCLEFINNSILNKNFYVRFDVNINNIHKHIFTHYKDAGEEILELFNSIDNNTIEQKVSQIATVDKLQTLLFPYYHNLLKQIYQEEPIYDVGDFFKYDIGNYMGKHADDNGERICTTVLYLNDMSEKDLGGDTLFYDMHNEDKIIYTYKPKRNDVIIFDSYLNNGKGMKHSVSKILNWYRYTHRIYWKKV